MQGTLLYWFYIFGFAMAWKYAIADKSTADKSCLPWRSLNFNQSLVLLTCQQPTFPPRTWSPGSSRRQWSCRHSSVSRLSPHRSSCSCSRSTGSRTRRRPSRWCQWSTPRREVAAGARSPRVPLSGGSPLAANDCLKFKN